MSTKNSHLYTGDALAIIKTFEDNSIDAIVTDPPYGISFIGLDWDHDLPDVALWKEALRVLKPGGHLLAFSSSRTYHTLATNIEQAGFDIRDQIMWLYSSGFPRSHNIEKVLLKKYNANIAKKWSGWGTTLKPAHEPVVVARKPFSGAVADNVVAFGTGGINIDGCRVPSEDNIIRGRFPANVVHSDIDEQWSPYFYCAKPTTKERDLGLGSFRLVTAHERTNSKAHQETKFRGAGAAARNFHPTVKPIKLMEYLITLVTSEDGTVLDPFAGSGSTLIAAKNLGYTYIGIEKEHDYADIARARLAA